MQFYHENEIDEITLDREPLLGEYIHIELDIDERRVANKEPKLMQPSEMESDTDTENENDIDRHRTLPAELDENSNIRGPIINFNPNADIDQHLLGLFVVSFDTKLGNIIEWQVPIDLNLDQIEFKAMASGFHLIQNDYVYFCKDDMFGLAAFESIRVDNKEERNIRMKSVGMIAKSYKFLKRFVVYLKNQARFVVENPGNYDHLLTLWNQKEIVNVGDYLEEHAAAAAASSTSPQNPSLIDKIFNKRMATYRQLVSENKTDYRIYTKFVLFFGPSIFCIWKYVLLNKRILFYSSPPIKDLCEKIICSIEMINTNYEYIRQKQLIKPIFYIHVTDIDQLQQEPFYLACTTEKIFENKEQLFDLYICDVQLKAMLGESQKNLIKVNSTDKKRYEALYKKINEPAKKKINVFSKTTYIDDDESLFIDFFLEQNDKIFSVLEELQYEQEPDTNFGFEVDNEKTFNLSSFRQKKSSFKRNRPNLITTEHIKQMGLDPHDDRDFLNELIRFYDFNLVLHN